jgi:Lon protease-like protein
VWIAFGLAAAVALASGLIVGAIAGGGDSAGNSVRVKALWYGIAKNGTSQGGLTPVDIRAVADDPRTPLSVDLRGLRAADAGPMWTAATAVAGVQAVLISGVDPRNRQLRYSLREAIDGPSAGALLGAGSLAAIRGSRISGSTTMTGTVLPDGSVGPVAGVVEKVRAAAEAGYRRVLIPAGRGMVLDPKTGRSVDPVKLGRSIGVDVKPVKNVPDAYALMTGQTESTSALKPPPIHAGILRMLARRSRALIATTNRMLKELARRAPGSTPKSESAHIAALVRAAERALAQRDPVLAFTAAAEAAQAVHVSEASARVRALAKRMPPGKLAAQLSREAERSFASIRAKMQATAEFPVTKVAQLTALADTLAWGDFALTSIRVAQKRLRTARTKAQLDEIEKFLAVARFEAAEYMSATGESLRYLGTRPIKNVDAIVGRLNAYSDLISYAADSNRVYAESLGLGTKTSYLAQLIEQSNGLTGWVSREFPQLRSPTARPALRMSVALLEYVETTQLVNDLTSAASQRTDRPPNLLPIKDPSILRNQAQTADEIARAQVRGIAVAGRDPSFVQWNNRWGADLAFGRLPGTTDEQKLHGLQYQWFAVLQARLLTTLANVKQ